jgi:hypothetical protein
MTQKTAGYYEKPKGGNPLKLDFTNKAASDAIFTVYL